MQISVVRYATASAFVALMVFGALALPLAALAGAHGAVLREAALGISIGVVACFLVVIVSLDLFEERARRGPTPD